MNNIPIIVLNMEEEWMRITRRYLRNMIDPFNMADGRFRELYRLPRHIARVFINELTPFMEEHLREDAVPNDILVLVTLNFLACGSYQRRVGGDFLTSMCQTKVSQAINEVCSIISRNIMRRYVRPPITQREKFEASEKFMRRYNFPGIIGLIDGTHVPLFGLKKQVVGAYINRKGFASKNVQIVCDYDLRITNVNARYPGSSHDSFIYQNSRLYSRMSREYELGEPLYWLLGDSGYALYPWLLTPYVPFRNEIEQNFNGCHTRIRQSVERCIGLLKTWFRCLNQDRGLMYGPVIAGCIINSCVVLHNIMINNRVVVNEVEYAEIVLQEFQQRRNNIADPAAPQDASLFHQGSEIRNEIANYILE